MSKILIVDQDPINSSKLKLVLSKYGTCDVATTGPDALNMFNNAHVSGEPFDFISVETTITEIKGDQLASQFRAYELEIAAVPAALLLLVNEDPSPELSNFLAENDIKSLVKPLNRKSLETLLSEIGLTKSETPVTPSTPLTPAPPQTPTPAPPSVSKPVDAKVQLILKKMVSIINEPAQLGETDFIYVMEELVKNGGKQAELALGQAISSTKLPLQTRLDLMQVAGNIKSPLLLVPLNRVIDAEDNIRSVETALMVIAKYGDQRALAILNNALKKLKNPMLLNTIRREMTRIKDHNPVLALLPRFLQSYKIRKNFSVTLDILKKIVTPEHTHLFVNYLKSGNDIIEDGSFELLCAVGDPAVKAPVFNYFEDRIPKITCLAEKECDQLYKLVTDIQQYLEKNIHFIDEAILELKELYTKITDIRAKHILLALLCQSQNSQALAFIKSVYNEEPELKEWIVEKLSGNQQAVDFLFEKYHAGQEVKMQVVKSLLKSEQGLQYFIKHFFTFELDKQELIIKNLSYSSQPYVIEFIRKIYQSNLYSMKCYLLHVLRASYLFEFENVLFDPDHQREFAFMGDDYLDTVCQLFPIATIKNLLHKISFEDISYSKVKKYLERIQEITEIEPVLVFRDVKLVNNLFNKIVNANNVDLNALFFSAFEHVKTLDLISYKYLIESTNTFIDIRGAQIQPKEKAAVTKFKTKLQEQIEDIRTIENITKELNVIFSNKPISIEPLEKLLKTCHFAVVLNVDKVIPYLAERVRKPEYMSKDDRELFYVNLPVIGKFIEYCATRDPNVPAEGLLKFFAKDHRIVISFEDKKFTALFKDQFRELLPELQVMVEMNPTELKKSDILICDVPVLKIYVDQKLIAGNRVYLHLENRGDYAQFREVSPKAFMQPISAHRVVKMILKELFLEG